MIDARTQGERIATFAGAAGISQRKLAKDSGLSQSVISRITNGQRAATAPELLTLAWALGVPLDELVVENPLSMRVQVSPRSDNAHTTDIAQVRERLLTYMRMDLHLDALGVPQVI